MPLERIRIESLRCIGAAELELAARRNYLYGPNGAGKTTVLEGIHLLGRGRSFRTRNARLLVRRGDPGWSVYGEVGAPEATRRIGIGFSGEGLAVRLDGKPVAGVARLAGVLPVHVLDPGLHQLIEGGPSERRRFLDWGVFHVEPRYLEAWRRYRKTLSQRNAGLKAGQTSAALRVWTSALADAAGVIDEARRAHVERLTEAAHELGQRLLGQAVQLRYRRGWRTGVELAAALEESLPRDRASGFTQEGPHRADLEVSLDAAGVREAASRGQQKLAAAALILAQVRVLAVRRDAAGTLLVDDPAAELDRAAVTRLMEVLEDLPAQLVLTALSQEQLPPAAGSAVFHVEQGMVRRVL